MVYSDVVTQAPADLWFEEKARLAGHGNGDALAAALDLRPYRRAQIYRAAAKELVADLHSITVLPLALRERLNRERFQLESLTPVTLQRSKDGQTTKGLFRLHDGNEVEAVLMEHWGGRSTVCISSQAGCAYKCAFCSTGQAGFSRNLGASEIFDQARFFARELKSRDKKVTNIVFMGQGEPFANFEPVMNAVALLNDPLGFGLGHRHITISTVGLVPQIERFTDTALQVNLAVSLHAPTDAQRAAIMPVNRRYPLGELMRACAAYVERTRRKVFFEYVMLAGVNDDDESAHALARLMRGRLYHVNLMPYNATPDAPLSSTPGARIRAFQGILDAAGVPTTVRTPMGRDIAAACGQLRAETQPKAHQGTAYGT
ncbi:MAG: 23S rRNA (adenine(2503)-C(2))-methyltransferase RlmN [Candidatus Eremiobacteraeota bacterium]|nr:23S rRNA (adenine(2503)-C(2))-methyltransferase RlmN [Candidatus Eremiobacteraeota bacterium]